MSGNGKRSGNDFNDLTKVGPILGSDIEPYTEIVDANIQPQNISGHGDDQGERSDIDDLVSLPLCLFKLKTSVDRLL